MSNVLKTRQLVADIHGKTLPELPNDFVSVVLKPAVLSTKHTASQQTPAQALHKLRSTIEALEKTDVELEKYPGRPLLVVRGPSGSVRYILGLEPVSTLIMNYEIEGMAYIA